ncbi:M14 family zinc carboxypeptidase [Bizionia sp.]|uniref:M14 family zinc carboxypeptidase n=1 Tax=Bizionia sp. TaxID=1954480 RepID=UPI003A95A98B
MYQSALDTTLNPFQELRLSGRYITNSMIEPLLKILPKNVTVSVEGLSVEKRSIYSIKLGTGQKRIMLWSQMHGNETTTTKALFDVLNTFKTQNSILDACTILIIPILNPDGAEVYTRLNANNVDLNRDAQNLSQPESRVLRDCFNRFKPNFCFNLHGQRTIFSVDNTSQSATVSFLSPAEDAERTLTNTRKIAMELIAVMQTDLQKYIPNQVALYDDGFNHNCVGDTFQSLGVPTVLFEAGHYSNDYNREITRAFIYKSLMVALDTISKLELTGEGYQDYLKIPENGTCFLDIIIRNVLHQNKPIDVGVQYQEMLINNTIQFVPKIEKLEPLDGYFGHRELDAKGAKVLDFNHSPLQVGNEIDSVWLNNENYSLLVAKT